MFVFVTAECSICGPIFGRAKRCFSMLTGVRPDICGNMRTAAGGRRGQIENYVCSARSRLLAPRTKFEAAAKLNVWVEDRQ